MRVLSFARENGGKSISWLPLCCKVLENRTFYSDPKRNEMERNVVARPKGEERLMRVQCHYFNITYSRSCGEWRGMSLRKRPRKGGSGTGGSVVSLLAPAIGAYRSECV
uniref:Uncharacterized protein n=1 Tax=Picea glauca TaxID=3330 RepID=A0A117NHB1_PICGL|nr:hypothetical protein ABT39_MTgene5092 [Picea glauca]QHR87721.1 hypothetical protein Q903MT_gene1733 [Picea sitchensis]